MQIGILKVLPGTPLAAEAEKYGIVYRERAPYEVIRTGWMSAEELVNLHMIENMVDIYYNRGGFSGTLEYLIAAAGKGPFGFFEKLSAYYYTGGYQHRNRKKEDQYRILRKFILESDSLQMDAFAREEAERLLTEDLAGWFNEEEQKRFYKKGWEVNV